MGSLPGSNRPCGGPLTGDVPTAIQQVRQRHAVSGHRAEMHAHSAVVPQNRSDVEEPPDMARANLIPGTRNAGRRQPSHEMPRVDAIMVLDVEIELDEPARRSAASGSEAGPPPAQPVRGHKRWVVMEERRLTRSAPMRDSGVGRRAAAL